MEVSDAKLREYGRRIMLSRMRLLCDFGFYGLLLMHLKVHVSTEYDTAWTDGKTSIFFCPDFLERVSDGELDYALSHELLHVVLDHVGRIGDYPQELFNLAADIVVNSNILRAHGGGEESIFLREYGGVQYHLTPNGEEGWKYTVEEVCEMLKGAKKAEGEKNHPFQGGTEEEKEARGDGKGNRGKGVKGWQGGRKGSGWDHHVIKGDGEESRDADELERQKWKGRILQAAEATRIREAQKTCGSLPAFVERYLEELKNPQTDWRTVLDEFIQEEVNDYSFCPPDKRYAEFPFFLPDYNEKDDRVEKVLFMIDTSGSMSDQEITQCYSEIKGAIDQFNGKLEGWLGFFDAAVTVPQPFSDEEEFRAIHPKGGGGTRFDVIFSCVRDNMMDDPPVSIVILTDGYAPFPDIRETMDIPVLWIINNEDVTPPWGKVARIKAQK